MRHRSNFFQGRRLRSALTERYSRYRCLNLGEVDRGLRLIAAEQISRVRAVISAQIAYASLCGGYAESLEELSRPSCKPNATDSTRLLSPDIVANRETSAYRFELVPSADVASRFANIAVPTQMHGRTMHAFCGDDSGRIYIDVRGVRPVVRDGQCQDRGTLVSMGVENGT